MFWNILLQNTSHNKIIRCTWAGTDPLYCHYHDHEWGVPVHDDQRFFEFILLEGAQAGLSWITVLRKREAYRKAFAEFDSAKVAKFDQAKLAELMENKEIIRNRKKLESAINNARAFLRIQEKFGSFDAYIWRFVDGKPLKNRWKTAVDMPANTPLSDRLSKDLKQHGFSFVGSTICYSFMQATGMVNDHTTDCFRWQQLDSPD